MSLKMRVGLGQFNEISEDLLAFIKQLGVDDFLMNTPKLPGDAQWEYEDLAAIKAKADAVNLRLMALENVPVSFYDRIMLGQEGREEQLQHMINTVRNMGKAGIPILGYHWMPNSVWRTPELAMLRGGGTVDERLAGPERRARRRPAWRRHVHGTKASRPREGRRYDGRRCRIGRRLGGSGRL